MAGRLAGRQAIQEVSGPRLAAQKAFFEAAMGKAAPAAPVQAAAPPAQRDFRASPQAMAQAQDEPRRILRPGSLLNIVV